ncbi:MAG: hypothetical protein V8T10_00160 [Merdibacter sp.]
MPLSCCMSPSPPSPSQLIELEEELDIELVHRGSHHIVLTEDGMRLKRRA